MIANVGIPLLLLIGVVNSEIESKQNPKPIWDFSLAFRGWYSNAGLGFTGNDSVYSEGRAIAPNLELDALRNRLLIRASHQFSTVFTGKRRIGTSTFDFAIERVDSEGAIGWEFGQHPLKKRGDVYFRALVGYKSLILSEDNLATQNIFNDFKHERQGPFFGLVGILRGTMFSSLDWDLKTTIAYAYLNTKVSQKMAPDISFRDPFHYFSDGLFLDVSFNFYLPFLKRDLQAMFGYKGQWYKPRVGSVRVRRVNPTPHGPEVRMVEVLTQKFQAEGFITGVSFKF